MTGKSIVIALVGTGCVLAAGTGSYLATRAALSPAEAYDVLTPTAEPVEAPDQSDPYDSGPTELPDAPEPEAPPDRVQPSAPEPDLGQPPDAMPQRARAVPRPTTPERRALESPADVTASTGVALDPVDVLPTLASTPIAAAPSIPVTSELSDISLGPPPPELIELTVEADSVIGLRLEAALSSETARVEDLVTALVSRDVTVGGRVAIPAGSRLEGHVTMVERGGRFRETAKLGLRFTSVILPGETRLPIYTATISRDGESPTGEATSKIGASAVVGSILGAVLGGKRGAAIGSAAGAAGGTAAVAAGGRKAAELAEGTPLTVSLLEPVTIVMPKDRR